MESFNPIYLSSNLPTMTSVSPNNSIPMILNILPCPAFPFLHETFKIYQYKNPIILDRKNHIAFLECAEKAVRLNFNNINS